MPVTNNDLNTGLTVSTTKLGEQNSATSPGTFGAHLDAAGKTPGGYDLNTQAGSDLIRTVTAQGGMRMASSQTAAAGFGAPALGAGASALPTVASTSSGGAVSGLGTSSSALSAGSIGSMTGSTGGGDTIASGATSTGSMSQSQLFAATQGMQEMQMSFNMQYLQLQNSMQNDNRQFTMVSNIMKTKHDTVKNTISNIH
jgi:hypothetical protein